MSQRAYIDSAVWISLVEGPLAVRNRINHELEQLERAQWVFCASEIVLMEVLYKPYRHNQSDLIAVYREFFTKTKKLWNYDGLLADSLQIVRTEGLKAVDSMHLALAHHYRCQLFVTSDNHFRTTSMLPVLWIDLTAAV